MAKKKQVKKNRPALANAQADAVTSQRQLAKVLGNSASTVSGWIRRDDWPAKKRGPWTDKDIEKIKEWRAWLQPDRSENSDHKQEQSANKNSESSGASNRQQIEYELKKQKMRKAKVEADEAEGRVIDRSIADTALGRLTWVYVNATDQLVESLPYKLSADPVKNAGLVRDAVDDIRRKLVEQNEIELKRIDDEVKEIASGKKKSRGRGRK